MKYPPSLAIKVSDSLGAHSERDHCENNFFPLLIESSEIKSDTDFAVFLRKSYAFTPHQALAIFSGGNKKVSLRTGG